MGYEVYLKRGEESRVIAGDPWVYANEVSKIEGKDKNGSLATVRTYDGRFVGKGYINHLSKILVRIFIRDEAQTDSKEFFMDRLGAADNMRARLGYTDSYRMVFAESDGLPALIVDRYGDILVMQCLSLGMDMRKRLLTECLVELFSPRGVYERSDAQVRSKEGLQPEKGVLYGDVPDEVIITENGLKMSVDVKNGQKTGYFLDQKENRFAARKYARDAEVLDCFCNSGGFSLNAATVAKSVVALDISDLALHNVERNAALNGLNNISTVRGDVFEILRQYKAENKKFDLIILDPPAFCKSASEVKDAFRGYKDINILAMKCIRSGGYLISCSCSHYMTLPLFEKMLTEAARESGKTVRTVEIKSQSPDHPALLSLDRSSYLKFFVLNVM